MQGSGSETMSNIGSTCVFTAHTMCYCQVVDCTSAGGVCNLDMIAKSQVAHVGSGVAIPLDVVKAWEQMIYTNLAAPKSYPVSAHIVYFILLSLSIATHFDRTSSFLLGCISLCS